MRQNPNHIGHRSMGGSARGTLHKVEHPHEYGFTSVPLLGGGGGGSSGGGGAGGKAGESGGGSGGGSEGGGEEGKMAEVFPNFISGNRSHPIVQTIADRRHRLKDLKEGDVALYDHHQHQIHMHKDGITISVPKGKKFQVQVMPDEKQKQEGGSGGSGGSGGGSAKAAEGGSSSSSGGGGSGKQYGQKQWAGQKNLAMFEISQDSFAMKHPKSIEHHIVDDKGEVKYTYKLDQDGKYTADVKNAEWNKK
jgi:phage gp45-like